MRATDDQKQKMKEFYQANKDRFAHYAANYRDQLKLEMIEAYGGACIDCGEEDPIVLTLDHINDDAHIEIEEYGINNRGGHKHYARLKKEGWPKERFQLLCCNCNARKEHMRRREGIVERWGNPNINSPVERSHVHAGRPAPSHNKSGFKGVFWYAARNKWQAQLMVKGNVKFLGRYDDIKEAAGAYKKAAIETWGDSANVPTDEEIAEIAASYSNVASLTVEDLGL